MYGWLFPRLGGLAVLLRRQHLIEPVPHVPQRSHVSLYRFQLIPFAGQGGGKVFALGFQLLAAVGRAGQVGLDIPGGCPVCVQLAPVGFLEFLLLLLPADGGILPVDRLVFLIVPDVGEQCVDALDPALRFPRAVTDGKLRYCHALDR